MTRPRPGASTVRRSTGRRPPPSPSTLCSTPASAEARSGSRSTSPASPGRRPATSSADLPTLARRGPIGKERPMSQRYLSGIQATGVPHIGNYIGAIRNWVASQDTGAETFYMIADLHAITVPTDRETMLENRLGAMAGLIGCGLDPARATLFFQSQVPEHSELAWLLSSQAYMGELNRMTQFKAKSAAGKDAANLALVAYPVLQAADILLYQTDFVPVGEDQVQHVELTRNIAQRLNGRYGETVKVPAAVVPGVGGRVMDLQQPAKKMSKTGNETVQGVIFLTDEDEAIARKVGRAVTDSVG